MTKSRGILAKRRYWTAADDDVLRRRYPHEETGRIARDLRRPLFAVYQHAANLGLRKSPEYLASPAACRLRRGDDVGSAHRFQKGHVPANKGLRRPGWHRGRMRETQFKSGTLNGLARQLWVPIGSYRINPDGHLDRKVADDGLPQRRWQSVHRLVWIEAHGPVPPNHAVCFRPGRRSTELEQITLDALELVHRRDLMKRNTVHNLPKPLAELVQLRGALNRKINARERELEKSDQ